MPMQNNRLTANISRKCDRDGDINKRMETNSGFGKMKPNIPI